MRSLYVCLFLIFLFPKNFSAQNSKGLDEKINDIFKPISEFGQQVVFWEIFGFPLILVLLIVGTLFFTIYFGFINIRRFPLAIGIVRGKYDELDNKKGVPTKVSADSNQPSVVSKQTKSSKPKKAKGEVSHFQALATAISGTVGNGNIAGVALAIAVGGPGATFWMILSGLFGMSTKFLECTLAVHYRDIGRNGKVYGGPMYYLSKGVVGNALKKHLGKSLAILFSVLCVFSSFLTGNAAQSNQAVQEINALFGFDSPSSGTIVGIILAILIGIIIVGGIKRIASITDKIVPFMTGFYILACLYILVYNFSYLDDAWGLIFHGAFTPQAGVGGFIGVLITGLRRGTFSNEAGSGSASIAHAAVKTKYPASEGVVALLEPFIDTVVICTMTALVIILYNMGGAFEYGGDGTGGVLIDGVKYQGAGITSKAFGEYIVFSDIFLTICVTLFAVSTMISWSYYGVQSWMFLFGKSKLADMTYKMLFLIFVVIGSAANMSSVWGVADAMMIAMIFPNMIGLALLYPRVKDLLKDYLKSIKESKGKVG